MSAIILQHITASRGASSVSNASDLASGTLSTVPSDTTPSSVMTGVAHGKWSVADIYYLTGILYPELTLSNALTFAPALETLDAAVPAAGLKLYATYPLESTLPIKFSTTAPISAGCLSSQTLLAESGEICTSIAALLTSFIHSLLSNPLTTSAICARYNVLASLYLAPAWRLESLLRGMRLLATTSTEELLTRRAQLEEVGEEDVLEARLEAYLLCCHAEEFEGWVRVGEDILGTLVEEREKMGQVYGNAAEYLREVFWEVVE